MSLIGSTVLITGGSRGIGRAIALRLAREGANISILAKSVNENPKLPGTIHQTAEEVTNAGGHALPIQCDIRFEEQIIAAIQKTVNMFGGIDIVINNASAINLVPTEELSSKRLDLMTSINIRGTLLVSKHAIPYLKKSKNPHILMLSPPISLKHEWFERHTAYTISKYGMSMSVIGLAAELEPHGIAVNALWPKTIIATEAMKAISPGHVEELKRLGRKPEVVADAAFFIVTKSSQSYSGHFTIDEDILKNEGVTDFTAYAAVPGTTELKEDLFYEAGYKFRLPLSSKAASKL